MKKEHPGRKAFFTSLISLVLCFTMLVGTTFAWFTDNAASKSNVIQAGNLELKLYWTDNLNSGTWHDVEGEYNTLFTKENWEPGYTEVRYLKIKNAGNLAFNFNLTLETQGEVGKLAEVINVYVSDNVQNSFTDREELSGSEFRAIGLLNSVINGGKSVKGTLLPTNLQNPMYESGEKIIAIALQMIPTAGNDYQGKDLGAGFKIKAIATQCSYESDSFDSTYDKDAVSANTIAETNVTAAVTSAEGKVSEKVVLTGNGVKATVPAGTVLKDGVSELRFTVKPLKDTASGITAVNDQILIPVDVHIEGIAEDNTVPVIIELGEVLPKYLNMGNYSLVHVENGANQIMTYVDDVSDLNSHNQFTYDSNTGFVTIAMASFSEVALVADTGNPWKGGYDYTWYEKGEDPYIITNADQLAGLGAIVGGMNGKEPYSFENKTVTLITDVDLGDGEVGNDASKIFYPIGYYNNKGSYARTSDTDVTSGVKAFKGIFDGNGHTISNFYQNTWEMFGDYNDGYSSGSNYYKDAMGLFGYVNGGTVKNLTVNNFKSDGEFTPTGVIAAYAADATFENIAITNCNPRVYNTGNGGIVGVGGNSGDTSAQKMNFTNITIDNSNKISALWGSWDVACGGLMGMFRGYSQVTFKNCHVGAQIDVYNDVCGNYQYYWYRYAGMMIGSLRGRNITQGGYTVPDMQDIKAESCTVHFGDWNDYWYCELVANSLASYTHDHQFSRLEQIDSLNEIKSGDVWTKTGNFILFENGKVKESGAGTCYHIMKDASGNLYEHRHDVADSTNPTIKETINGAEILKENNQRVYLPFNQLFQGDGWGVKHVPIYDDGKTYYEGITILDRDVADSEEKFEVIETIKDKQLRVGNLNAFPIGKIFKAKEGAKINTSGVHATVISLVDGMEMESIFTPKSSWEESTLEIKGAGPAKIIIQDYEYCKPTEFEIEVIEAKNATSSMSATANDVVLLSDMGFSTLVVSGGYTLHGNGFTLSSLNDITGDSLSTAYIELDNGTLDNVRVICPNFSHQIMYMSQAKVDGNVDPTAEWRYKNIRSAVSMVGKSTISNSYISGGRAGVFVLGGNATIDNTMVYAGALANIHVNVAQSVVLRDLTLVQQPTKATVNDTNITKMGFSVVVTCSGDGSSTPITLEGTLNQYAWANNTYEDYFPDKADTIVNYVMQQNEYKHNFSLHEGEASQDWLNLGFAYMPADLGLSVDMPTLNDNRIDSDKTKKQYDWVKISALGTEAYVYSIKNTGGTDETLKTEPTYTVPDAGTVLLPKLSFKDVKEGITFSTVYDELKGWTSTVEADLDTLKSYSFKFENLVASKNGKQLTYTVTSNESNIDIKEEILLTGSGITDYILQVTDGNIIHKMPFTVVATRATINPPEKIAEPSGTPLLVVKAKNSDWSCALPALEGTEIKYWSVAEGDYITLVLSTLTPEDKGARNGTNNFWEYTGANNDYYLKVTCGVIHEGKNVYGMPVVVDNGGNKMYFTISSDTGYVGTTTTARTVTIDYLFRDNNGGELTFSKTWQFNYADYKNGKQYSYSDFVKGTLKEAGCVTPDTLVTLADGSQVRVDSLTGEEQLLVWNMETGSLDSAAIMFNDSEAEAEVEVIKLTFSDGTTVDVISEHGFWDYDLNRYVYLDRYADKYIGHWFAKRNGDELERVQLVDVVLATELTTAWSPVTEGHLCYFVNGMLSMPGGVGGLFNIFDVDAETMTYDFEAMAKDIETYGLFTYEELSQFAELSEDMFYNAGGPFLKVSMAKGNLTESELIAMIQRYGKYFE